MASTLRLFLPTLVLTVIVQAQTPGSDRSHTLWYAQPAGEWDEGLPIGNGRLGAMDMGGVASDRLQLNEGTLTSGEPGDDLRSIDIRPDYAKVTAMLKARQYAQADAFITSHWLGRQQQCYEPLGDLTLTMDGQLAPTGYRRWLDLDNAIVGTQWTQDKVVYTREAFASYPDQVIVVRLSASRRGSLNFKARLSSVHPTAHERPLGPDTVEMKGQIPGFIVRRPLDYIEGRHEQSRYPELFNPDGSRRSGAAQVLYGDKIGGKGMRFDARFMVKVSDGSVATLPDGTCVVQGATDAVLIFSAGSSFNGFDKSPSMQGVDPTKATERHLNDARHKLYGDLLARHESDYRALFDRVSFSLPTPPLLAHTPTDLRLKAFAKDNDPGLAALLFHFGRYLLIAGSRQGGQPTNLQGLWNEEVMPPWTSSYTVNINTEMNYWPAEVTQLSELTDPLFRMLQEEAITGGATAKNMYGNRGWVAHHNLTLWRDSYPVDGNAKAAFWNMTAGWFSSHLWEHYLFTGDREFLQQTAYPLMKGAAEFYSDWLVPADDGTLVTPISTSPENSFRAPDGKAASTSVGSTMDMTIIRELFTRTIEAASILGLDADLQAELKGKLAKLAPFRINERGQLQEWREDFAEVEPHHRHMSHLYGLFPGNQISAEATPQLFAAAKRSLELRGDEATGWAMTWRIALWARVQDGNHALSVIRAFIKPAHFENGDSNHGGGLYRSLLDACPPFQIDGNYGYTAAVAEMLLQSHAGFIQLLPALPADWPQGSISGLKTRGGFEVSIDWRLGRLERAVIHSTQGGICRIRFPKAMILHGGEATPASGPNPNRAFEVIDPGQPVIAANADLTLPVPKAFVMIDVPTHPGQTLVLSPDLTGTKL